MKYSHFFKNTDGTAIELSVGVSSAKSQGVSIGTHHYRISGGFTEDIWFSEDGLLARLEMAAKDGSSIIFSGQW